MSEISIFQLISVAEQAGWNITVGTPNTGFLAMQPILSLLSNATVGALIRNVGPSESMIRLSFNMAAASHTWFRNEEF